MGWRTVRRALAALVVAGSATHADFAQPGKATHLRPAGMELSRGAKQPAVAAVERLSGRRASALAPGRKVDGRRQREPSREPQVVYRVYRITAYDDRGLTAAGLPSGTGQCAAPEDIPFGARVYIPALDRSFVVTDRTSQRFRQNTIDLFIPGRQDCLAFGRQYLECVITLPAQDYAYGSRALQRLVARFQ